MLQRRACLLALPLAISGCSTPRSIQLRLEAQAAAQTASLAVPDLQRLSVQVHAPLTGPSTQPGFHLAVWSAHGRIGPGQQARFRGRQLRYEANARPGDIGEPGPGTPWSEPDRLWLDEHPIPLPTGLSGRLFPIELAVLPSRQRLLLVSQAYENGPLWLAIVSAQGERLLDWRRRGSLRLQADADGLLVQIGETPAWKVQA